MTRGSAETGALQRRNPPHQAVYGLFLLKKKLDSYGRGPGALRLVVRPTLVSGVDHAACRWPGKATGQADFATIRLLNVPATSRAGPDGRAVSEA